MRVHLQKRIVDHYSRYRYKYVALAIISLLIELFMQVVGFHYKPSPDRDGVVDRIHEVMHKYCTVRTKNPWLQKIGHRLRGENYITTNSPEDNQKYTRECIVTPWNMFHFSAHFVLVLLFPECWVSIFLVSLTYEAYEYVAWKCHDYGDIFYNALGVALGLGVRQALG